MIDIGNLILLSVVCRSLPSAKGAKGIIKEFDVNRGCR